MLLGFDKKKTNTHSKDTNIFMLSALIFNPYFGVNCRATGPFQCNWNKNERRVRNVRLPLRCELNKVLLPNNAQVWLWQSYPIVFVSVHQELGLCYVQVRIWWHFYSPDQDKKWVIPVDNRSLLQAQCDWASTGKKLCFTIFQPTSVGFDLSSHSE